MRMYMELSLRITNKLGLPEPIVEAIKNDAYSKGASDISATSLIKPVRMVALENKHADEIEEDAADRIYSLQGQSVHTILERAAISLTALGWVSERRFYLEVSGLTISAQIDLFHVPTGRLQDYKVTSVYAVRDGIKEEYAQQVNMQAYLMKHGYELVDGEKVFRKYEVKQAQIVAILRDWSKMEASRDEKFPPHQVKVLEVPLIDETEVLGFITDRVEAHKAARNGGVLPLCTKEERWAKDDVFAVRKKGAAKATRLCSTEQAAQLVAEDMGPQYAVEYRPGVSTRCQFYCPVSSHCEQFQKTKEKK